MSAPIEAYALALQLFFGGAAVPVQAVDMTDTSVYRVWDTCVKASAHLNKDKSVPPALGDVLKTALSYNKVKLSHYAMTCAVVVTAPPVDPDFYGDE